MIPLILIPLFLVATALTSMFIFLAAAFAFLLSLVAAPISLVTTAISIFASPTAVFTPLLSLVVAPVSLVTSTITSTFASLTATFTPLLSLVVGLIPFVTTTINIVSSLITTFASLLSLVSPVIRGVWVPPIIYPDASAQWVAGETYTVIWDTSSEPARVTNPTGYIYLRHGDATQSNPIASGFPLTAGSIDVTIPADTRPGTTWKVVLVGDSGNWGPTFTILAASS